MTDDGDEIALPSRLDAQHAEAVLRVMKSHPVDEPAQDLQGSRRPPSSPSYPDHRGPRPATSPRSNSEAEIAAFETDKAVQPWPRDWFSSPEADFGELTSLICETITGAVAPEGPERQLR
jgi:hypothetical protein